MSVVGTIRVCEGCGNGFSSSDPRKKRCVKNCGRKRTNQSRNGARNQRVETHTVQFFGVDGEGITNEDGSHDYVMLSVGEETLTNDTFTRLSWEEMFEFMWDHFCRHNEAVYVGFFLGYDFTQWLRTIPMKKAHALLTKEGIDGRKRKESGGNPVPYPVRLYGDYGKWEIDILGARRFKLRPHTPRDPFAKKQQGQPWLYVNDSGPFWQCSFLTAINPEKWPTPVTTDEEYATIVEGKSNRSAATVDDVRDGSMAKYNVTENRVLARVMARLNEGFVKAGIRLDRDQWYGPGQAAQAWLDLIEAPTSEEIQAAVPKEALLAAQATYYGGWFEIMAHGHVPGTTYEYDINSAYPHIIAQLPCLLHGKWTSGKGSRRKKLAPGHLRMVLADVRGDNNVTGCMPFRLHTGNILRPKQGLGWYWWHELEAARAAGLIRPVYGFGQSGIAAGIKIHEWVEYAPCDCAPPIGAIADLYQRRLEAGKNSPEGVSLKLMYNSAYGKFAQSIGSPKYANPVYASLITAGCRTMILQAIATHPTKTDSLVMVATDGVYFREPHGELELSPSTLGAWDVTEKTNLTLMMPGVYWDDKTRDKVKEGIAPVFKSRGISARDLSKRIGELDQQWTEFREMIETIESPRRLDPDEWPSLELDINFAMTSAKQAIVRGKWETAGEVSSDSVRTISTYPVLKRTVAYTDDLRVDKGTLRSEPFSSPPFNTEETFYYAGTFGMDFLKALQVKPDPDDPFAPSGTTSMDLLIAGREEEPLGKDADSQRDLFSWFWSGKED